MLILGAVLAPGQLAGQTPESPADPEPATILALHSYNSEYEWTSNIIAGLTATLEHNLPGHQIFHEFMFAKAIPPESYESTLVDLLEQRYRDTAIDLVFVSDEAAYGFFYRYGEQLFPGVPMVFAGVDRLIPQFQRIARPHTGIMEQIDAAPTVELMASVHPQAERLLILSDERSILPRIQRQIEDAIRHADWQAEPLYLIAPAQEELGRALAAHPDAPMFYLGYFRPPEAQSLTLQESVELVLSHGPRPIYSSWEDAIGTGVLGGYMLSGTAQGKRAGSLIAGILRDNIDPVRLPTLTRGGNAYLADYRVMQELGISPDAFPAATEFRNRPADFLVVYRHYFTVTLAVMSLLGLLVLGLLINLRLLKREQGRTRALSQAVESTSHAIYITDPTPRITYVNKAFETLTGYAAAEVIGENPRLLQSGKMSPEYYTQLWDTITSGQTWKEEIVNRRRDGSTYVAEQSISPLVNRKGRIEGFVAIQIDTTERRAIQDALIHAKESAEKADRAKSAFLAGISHEIRTPLNGILGFAHLIQESAPPDPIPGYAEHIVNSGNNLASIINDILDLSIIEADLLELQPEAVHIVPGVQDILAECSEAAAAKGIHMGFSATPKDIPPLKLDPQRIRQVIGNLIDNAIKFTSEGRVDIRISWSPLTPTVRNRGTLTISVRDSGIGISEEQLEQIFRAFHQIDHADSRRYGGTGLGLAITRQLVAKMGGSLAAESTPGSGSHFRVTLPDVPVLGTGPNNASDSASDSADYSTQRPEDTKESTASAAQAAAASPPGAGATVSGAPDPATAGFSDRAQARAWYAAYQEQEPQLRARSVPAEILAWAESQAETFALLPQRNPARIITALGTAARSWDITGMQAGFRRLEEYALSLAQALAEPDTEDV